MTPAASTSDPPAATVTEAPNVVPTATATATWQIVYSDKLHKLFYFNTVTHEGKFSKPLELIAAEAEGNVDMETAAATVGSTNTNQRSSNGDDDFDVDQGGRAGKVGMVVVVDCDGDGGDVVRENNDTSIIINDSRLDTAIVQHATLTTEGEVAVCASARTSGRSDACVASDGMGSINNSTYDLVHNHHSPYVAIVTDTATATAATLCDSLDLRNDYNSSIVDSANTPPGAHCETAIDTANTSISISTGTATGTGLETQSAEYTCSTCTFINSVDATECAMCLGLLYRAPKRRSQTKDSSSASSSSSSGANIFPSPSNNFNKPKTVLHSTSSHKKKLVHHAKSSDHSKKTKFK